MLKQTRKSFRYYFPTVVVLTYHIRAEEGTTSLQKLYYIDTMSTFVIKHLL